ncbi:MAG: class I SAM-dependent methyltransferase [bacterium]|nr:class I SAM-dependent methyltransferase [bacterium]
MEIIEYKLLFDAEKVGFWPVARREILREKILKYQKNNESKKILDIGCGPGGNILLLKEFGHVTGLDFSEEALKFAKTNNFDSLVQASATNIPFIDASFDMVTSLDVLEHIQDDNTAIQEALRVLKPGGMYVVTVPAYQALWSQHDVSMHHIRRYLKSELLSKLNKVGFEIDYHTYFIMLSVPIRILQILKDKLFKNNLSRDKVSNKVEYSGPVNSFLLFLLRIEKIMLRYVKVPFGTSILVIARKNRVD